VSFDSVNLAVYHCVGQLVVLLLLLLLLLYLATLS